MSESLTQQYPQSERRYKDRKALLLVKIMTKTKKKRWPILVPAAAVIRVALVLFLLIGRKGCVGGIISWK